MTTRIKALALLSGGLDSSIAIVFMKKLGIDIEGVFFSMPFCQAGGGSGGKKYVERLCENFKLKLHVINNEDTLIGIIKDPKHGFGHNMNPCIDCRAAYFTKAKMLMKDIGASFLVTGEVLGQRPMSQRLEAMQLIDKEAGLEGMVLRPLCAKKLPATLPEKEGWIDREKLLGITGRGRKEQMKLAGELGIVEYPSPAGGCLLTDPGFTRRLAELKEKKPDFTAKDAELLKFGRHFRLDDKVKLVIGRYESDNNEVEKFLPMGGYLLYAKEFNGPVSFLTGEGAEKYLELAAGMTARFTDAPDKSKPVEVVYKAITNEKKTIKVLPKTNEETEKLRIK